MTAAPYPFDVLQWKTREPRTDPHVLAQRPLARKLRSLAEDAPRFLPGEALATAINTAVGAGQPLLITGEPGTGKTQTAYYVAWKLQLGDVLHFSVKSDSTAKDLLYHFDTVRHFQDANLKLIPVGDTNDAFEARKKYREKRKLWTAFDEAKKREYPCVLLIDEIDKAPRDFPNDLLHELDQMEISCPETNEHMKIEPHLRPLVFITSNSERRLPEPFLRRCVYHHIQFDSKLVEQVLQARRDEFASLTDGFLKLAVERFLAIRSSGLIKPPSTGEFLVWVRVLALAADVDEDLLKRAGDDFSKLKYLGTLLKNRQDLSGERK